MLGHSPARGRQFIDFAFWDFTCVSAWRVVARLVAYLPSDLSESCRKK